MNSLDKRHFISITVLISALAFNPLAATEINLNVLQNSSQQQTNPLTSVLASHLYKRGLDEDAAEEISQEFVDGHDDHLNDMINHLVYTYTELSHEEVFEHLSTEALHKRTIDLGSYDHLVNMLTKIKGDVLSVGELKQLHSVSKRNQMYT